MRFLIAVNVCCAESCLLSFDNTHSITLTIVCVYFIHPSCTCVHVRVRMMAFSIEVFYEY